MNTLQLEQLKAELLQYPQNPLPESPHGERRRLVASLLDEIGFLRTQRYSFTEISRLLHQKTDILIKSTTLRKYFFEEKAKRSNSSPSQKHSQPSHSKGRLGRSANKRASQPKAAKVSVTAAHLEPELTDPEQAPVAIADPDSHPAESLAVASMTTNPPTAWSNNDWDDGNPPAGGLLNESRFNEIQRD